MVQSTVSHQVTRRMSDQSHLLLVFMALMLGLLSLQSGGCASIRVTDPPRTATEQFLLAEAAEEAVNQLDFEGLRGRDVFVDSEYFAASEDAFVLGELRARLLLGGVQLVRDRDIAEIVLEVRSSGVGIDRTDYLLGIPSLVLSPEVGVADGTGTPVATPELSIIKSQRQRGVASVAFVAYWRDTGEVVASSGPFIGRTLREDWWFFGLGPRTIGDISSIETPQ